MDIEKNISKALGLPIPEKPKKEVALKPFPPASGVDDDDDYLFIRDTLRDLIQKGNAKLDEMGEIASELESARAFEVYGTMMEKISGLTKELYDIHKKKKDLKEESKGKLVDNTNISVDKAVFVGSTAELLEQIKIKNKNE